MNSINLITMLYGQQGPQPASAGASNSLAANGAEGFSQFLGHQLASEVLAGQQAQRTCEPAGTVSPATLLSSLLEAIRSILDAGTAAADAAFSGCGMAAGPAGDATGSAGSQDGLAKSALPAWLTAAAGESGGSSALEQLFVSWPSLAERCMAQLSALLGSDFTVTSGDPVLLPGSAMTALTPWQTISTASGNPAAAGARPSSETGLNALLAGAVPATDSLAGAPASIRWFARQAALPASMGLSPGSTLPVNGKLVLPSGETIMLELATAPGTTVPGQPARQSFALSAWSPDSDLGVLSAKLSVQFMASPLHSQPASLNATSAATAGGPGAISAQAANLTAQNLPASQAGQVPEHLLPGVHATRSNLGVQPASVSASQAGQPVSDSASAGAIMASANRELLAAQLDSTAAKSAPGPRMETANGGNGNAAQEAAIWEEPTGNSGVLRRGTSPELQAGILSGRSPSAALLSQGSGRTPLSGSGALRISLGSNPSGEQLQPQAAALPAQLMQFSGREFEMRPLGGMEFRELAARLMDQAESARSAGNGTYQATLDMDPPNLGRVSVNIAVRGETVALQLAVASSAPREQLRQGLAALQQSLEAAGLKVLGMKVVTVDPDASGSAGYGSGGEDHSNEPGPDDTGTGVFEQFVRESGAEALTTRSA